MRNSDRLYLSQLSLIADYDTIFEGENLQDFEYDDEINQLLDATDFNETDDNLRDEDSLKGSSNRFYL